MKKIFLLLLLPVLMQQLNAQNILEKSKVEKLLSGKWSYVMTVNEKNEQIKYIEKQPDPKLHQTKIQRQKINPQDISLNENGSFSKDYQGYNFDSGKWKLIKDNLIEFKTMIPKDSGLGQFMKKNEKEKTFDTKFKKDKEGNYFIDQNAKIISISDTELRITNKDNLITVYKK